MTSYRSPLTILAAREHRKMPLHFVDGDSMRAWELDL
jgi:hypothetical protein